MKWFREAELMNGRWAMAAVVGILFTDLVSVLHIRGGGAGAIHQLKLESGPK